MGKGKRHLELAIYIISDFLMAGLAWTIFFLYRKKIETGVPDVNSLDDPQFYLGIIVIPVAWILFYALFDRYSDIYRISRLNTIWRTMILTFFGVIILFFTLLLDDVITDYKTYYKSFFALLFLHFSFTIFMRMIILTRASKRLKAGKVTFKTLLIGANQNALSLYNEIHSRKKGLGYNIVGYIDTNHGEKKEIEPHLDKLGHIENIRRVVVTHEIEEVIIAIETSEKDRLRDILDALFRFDSEIQVSIIPNMYDILLGHVKMKNIFGAVLINIEQNIMPHWQQLIKRVFDICVSIVMLIILSPLYLYIIIRVRLSSSGPIFYKQERIGRHEVPFDIIKFRSMYTDAESAGPMLSSDTDDRCTPWGRTMRVWRLDELPQFWNVLIGEMSLVGPRPERQYFIDKIKEKAPHYHHLLTVRPGITSWGQVKYGYASNVDEMVQRLKFDILYIENRSLSLDVKILFYTVIVLIQGKGK